MICGCAATPDIDPDRDLLPDAEGLWGEHVGIQGEIELGTAVRGDVSERRRLIGWTFHAERGDSIRFSTLTEGLAAYVAVAYARDEDGQPGETILEDSRGQCLGEHTGDSCVEFVAPQTRTYTVVVYLGRGTGPDGTIELRSGLPRSTRTGRETIDHPEVGHVQFFPSTVCSGTLVAPDLVLTAAECVERSSDDIYQTVFEGVGEGGTPHSIGTFRIERGDDESYVYRIVAVARFGDSLGFALAQLWHRVPPEIAEPAQLADSAPQAGEPMTRYGYGCMDNTTRDGAGVKRAFSYIYGDRPGRACAGDEGGATFGPRGLHLLTRAFGYQEDPNVMRDEATTVEVHPYRELIAWKERNWRAECPDWVGDRDVCDIDVANTVTRCWLGYRESRTCSGACVPGAEAWEQAECWEDVYGEDVRMVSGAVRPGAPIPEADESGVGSSILIADDLVIDRVAVSFGIHHRFPFTLTLTLTHVDSGAQVVLADGSLEPTSDSVVRETVFVPELVGQSSRGVWRLTVVDHSADSSVGDLLDWSITIHGR
ncbi:MAG: proprotein convertase P-domain-containing protein [Sandaracinaceae bacterium]